MVKFSSYIDNNLNGTIPDTISQLTNLQLIDIRYNELVHGAFPDSVCQLTPLRRISFLYANLSGEFPGCVGNMSSMQVLQLNDAGPLLTFRDSVLTALCQQAKGMQLLSFWSINYIGSIPECIGDEFTDLNFLQFAHLPNLNSTIPRSLTKLTEMQVFGRLLAESAWHSAIRALVLLSFAERCRYGNQLNTDARVIVCGRAVWE